MSGVTNPGAGSGGSASALSGVLAIGNTSGGNDIVTDGGDRVLFPNGTRQIPS